MSKKPLVLFIAFTLIMLVGCTSKETSSKSDSNGSLPNTMTWSVYDVGASGYAEMSAIADMLTEKYDMNIRMLPSASGVGRMTPLKEDIASIAKLGEEAQFAFEGIQEYSSQRWGPQNLRAIWAPISHYGFATRGDSSIETIEDLKGKKVPKFPGNSSVNVKSEAMLAFGGLTWEDVEVVELTSYSGQADALIQGQIDVISGIPNTSSFVEADSKGGIKWIEMDPEDTEGWERVKEVAPWVFSETRDDGAGIESDTSLIGYGYLIAGYSDQENVKELVTAISENFDQYKNALPSLEHYSIDKVLTEPKGIPFHEGTIQFFKENNLWDEQKQEKNDELIERYEQLESAWDQVKEEANKQKIPEEEFPDFWLQKKDELIQ